MFERYLSRLESWLIVINPISRIVWAIDRLTTATQEGFAKVEQAIRDIQQPPQPLPIAKGKIMAEFQIPANTPDFSVALIATDFKDDEGNPVGAEDIDLSVASSNPAAIEVLGVEQQLSEDGKSVTATANIHVGAPADDFTTLSYKATNRDTETDVAVGSDSFWVLAGEAVIGTVTSTVPLTPVEPGT